MVLKFYQMHFSIYSCEHIIAHLISYILGVNPNLLSYILIHYIIAVAKILRKWYCTEKAMAPHSSTLAWKIPRMEEPGRLWSMGPEESGTTERLHFHSSLSCIREGNGDPLRCSCLENPRDRGAWWAAMYGVAQSQTRLK